ncbi:COX15/CtaA family protein [Pontibacter rugosus]
MEEKSTYNKAIVYWLLTGAVLVMAMVIIGGITRLTNSGLSIVEWNLISGTLPPFTDAAWMATFEKYKQFPEYRMRNVGMTLQGFKQIFWWEYLHRLLGRVIGLVFILPFLYFLTSGQLTPKLTRRLLFILLLGMAQGLMGWLMVKSGLVDNPHVSHYRLAAHLCLALAVVSVILWTAADLVWKKRQQQSIPTKLYRLALLVPGLLLLQIILGAFVAGLKAGYGYNTFPLMQGKLFPTELLPYLSWHTVLENGAAMQFAHRWVGVLSLVVLVLYWLEASKAKLPATTRSLVLALLLTGSCS